MRHELWEILVPTIDREKTEYVKGFHKKWDAKVREISGGLTIRSVEKGQWVHPVSKSVFAERMIPVKISGTRRQIEEICWMTAKYYDQEVVMAYRISEEVLMVHKDGTIEE
jgi:hypothetical protein